ncbi:hypothetical protein ACIQOV_29570, partial [Kitasatospora sp. NPDC091257]|uniref:hypothetical protein n=1 Tax=Kitasatospora sp. NPDC091257 TaxID=3364084 RepID=UPI003810CD30
YLNRRWTGPIDPRALRTALGRLAERHEILRTLPLKRSSCMRSILSARWDIAEGVVHRPGAIAG